MGACVLATRPVVEEPALLVPGDRAVLARAAHAATWRERVARPPLHPWEHPLTFGTLVEHHGGRGRATLPQRTHIPQPPLLVVAATVGASPFQRRTDAPPTVGQPQLSISKIASTVGAALAKRPEPGRSPTRGPLAIMVARETARSSSASEGVGTAKLLRVQIGP